MGVAGGIQKLLKSLDPGVRRDDERRVIADVYETIGIDVQVKSPQVVMLDMIQHP